MICPKCGSENVTSNIINEVKLKTKHKGILYWTFVGWWWIPFKWLFLTLPALIVALFKGKQQKAVNKTRIAYHCNDCDYVWKK